MNPTVRGLVLAAGTSRRMDALKPLLPVGDRPAVIRAARVFSDVGVRPLVVLGFAAETVAAVLREAAIEYVVNEGFEAGMFSSVRAGLGAVGESDGSVGILPADCCLVRPETVGRLARAMREAAADVVYPIAAGTRGHPPLLGARARRLVLAADPRSVLREVLGEVEDWAVEVQVEDGAVLLDMDDRPQYERVLELVEDEGLPDEDQCEALYRREGTPQPLREHAAVVAAVARALGGALQPSGAHLNLELLDAAALLHDIARGAPDHAAAGARLLADAGYPRVAAVVAHHMDLPGEPPAVPGEAEVLFLADKLVAGGRGVTLDERLRATVSRFSGDAQAVAAAEARLAAAGQVAAAVERLTGRALADILASARPAG